MFLFFAILIAGCTESVEPLDECEALSVDGCMIASMTTGSCDFTMRFERKYTSDFTEEQLDCFYEGWVDCHSDIEECEE